MEGIDMDSATHVMPVPALQPTVAVPARAPQSRRIAGAVQRQLQQSPYRSIRTLQCEYESGALVLRGSLPTFYLKQLAQSIALRVPGVAAIRDLIEVAYQPADRRIGCPLPR
jgi:hypothetical protein